MMKFENVNALDADFVGLLAAEHLPTADLAGASKRYFGFRDARGDLVAAGGLEICGSSAILRSCVVASTQKGRQLGTRLIDFIIEAALDMRVDQLFLLTETAPGFFRKFGFREIKRNSVPVDVAGSAQFAEICPESAVAMAMTLPVCPQPDLQRHQRQGR